MLRNQMENITPNLWQLWSSYYTRQQLFQLRLWAVYLYFETNITTTNTWKCIPDRLGPQKIFLIFLRRFFFLSWFSISGLAKPPSPPPSWSAQSFFREAPGVSDGHSQHGDPLWLSSPASLRLNPEIRSWLLHLHFPRTENEGGRRVGVVEHCPRSMTWASPLWTLGTCGWPQETCSRLGPLTSCYGWVGGNVMGPLPVPKDLNG